MSARNENIRSKRRKAALGYVEKLLDLWEASNLESPEAASGKDSRATVALSLAESLNRVLIGWAQHHRAGLPLSGLKPLPYSHPRVRGSVQRMQAEAAVDDHKHELAGYRDIAGEQLASSPLAMRSYLRSQATKAGWPPFVRDAFVRSLDELSLGNTPPLFAPVRGRKKLWRHWMAALTMAEYRRGKGHGPGDADGDVCVAFGIDQRTLVEWKKNVRKHLGDLELKQTLAFAHVAGEQSKYFRRNPKREDPDAAEREAQYGDAALEAAGIDYQAHGKKTTRKHVRKPGTK